MGKQALLMKRRDRVCFGWKRLILAFFGLGLVKKAKADEIICYPYMSRCRDCFP